MFIAKTGPLLDLVSCPMNSAHSMMLSMTTPPIMMLSITLTIILASFLHLKFCILSCNLAFRLTKTCVPLAVVFARRLQSSMMEQPCVSEWTRKAADMLTVSTQLCDPSNSPNKTDYDGQRQVWFAQLLNHYAPAAAVAGRILRDAIIAGPQGEGIRRAH
ncbi:hypothetical protein EDB19DRAFT_2040988 [Suillus lakei]|nr:hypothetical protein EDB19DRAFT_2040988 [Suillus lakei]